LKHSNAGTAELTGSASVSGWREGRKLGTMSSSEIVKQWVTAINGHEVTALTALMAVDHVFVDSLGSWLPARLEGR